MGIFDQTPEQKAHFAEVNRKRNEELVARKAAEAQAAIERQQTIEANRKINEQLAAQKPASAKTQAGTLTEKQQIAVARMLREWEVLTVIGLPGGLKVEDFYPHIEAMFAFNRREITEAQFSELTGIALNLSTFNRLSDHDL